MKKYPIAQILIICIIGLTGLLLSFIEPSSQPAPEWEDHGYTYEEWLTIPRDNPYDSATWAAFCQWSGHDPAIFNIEVDNYILDVWMETDNYVDFCESTGREW